MQLTTAGDTFISNLSHITVYLLCSYFTANVLRFYWSENLVLSKVHYSFCFFEWGCFIDVVKYCSSTSPTSLTHTLFIRFYHCRDMSQMFQTALLSLSWLIRISIIIFILSLPNACHNRLVFHFHKLWKFDPLNLVQRFIFCTTDLTAVLSRIHCLYLARIPTSWKGISQSINTDLNFEFIIL